MSKPGSGQRPEKTMSSRLLTMKFMQRAAASSPSPSVPTPSDSTPPSSKRQKTTHSTPSTPATPLSDQAAIRAALNAEEAQREAAIARLAAERGETKWVLSFVDAQKDKGGGGLAAMKVVKAGYGDIDGDGNKVGEKENGVNRPTVPGRRSFGNFNKELEKQQNRGSENSSSSDEASEADGMEEDYNDDDENGIRESIQKAADPARAQRKTEKKAAKAEAVGLAEQKNVKEVKLKKLRSISGTDGGRSRNSDANIECHACGAKGHKKADCPNRGSRRKGDFDGGRPGKKPNRSEPLNY